MTGQKVEPFRRLVSNLASNSELCPALPAPLREKLAQKPLSENCHLGREGTLRTLASGYVAHLQSSVETVLKDATHVAHQ